MESSSRDTRNTVHDAQLVLLAEPDDEAAIGRLVAAAAAGPIRSDARRSKERIRRHIFEHDVHVHECLVVRVGDQVWIRGFARHFSPVVVRSQRVDFPSIRWVSNQLFESCEHCLLEVDAVSLGHRT